MNLANNLETSAFFFPERTAVRQAGIEWTYAQLNDHSSRIATGLIRMGVKPGEHVGLCAMNSADWIAFYVAETGAIRRPSFIRAVRRAPPKGLCCPTKGSVFPVTAPKEFIVTGDLPKSPTGKILKRELKKHYMETGKS